MTNMEKPASMEVVAINSDDDEHDPDADKPIIQLFKRLIISDNKQSTVLTNAQIVDILDKEFGINLWDIHELEGEIYLTIMKKYLKDWPQWDEFDKKINVLKNKNDTVSLNKMLDTNYLNLKKYLKVMLDRAQTLAKSTVNKLLEDKTIETKLKDNKSDNVVLEIQCSRNHLNQLFYRSPNPELNYSIFNGTIPEPTQIKLNPLPLEAILNWWDVKITIQKGSIQYYERRTMHQLNHVLVNKVLMARYNPLKTLSQELQTGRMSKGEKVSMVDLSQYINKVTDILMKENPSLIPLLKFVRKDLRLLPDKVVARSSYKRYMNKYPYLRYLCKDLQGPNTSMTKKYDLQLEETVSPTYRVFLGGIPVTGVTVHVECVPCEMKFNGDRLLEELRTHFEELHSEEPDWRCTNCGKTFPMRDLAATWWTHKC